MNKESRPSYVPESDTKPLLQAEQHPQPTGPSPFGNVQVHVGVPVTTQPAGTLYPPTVPPQVPAWVGSDMLIYFSVFTTFCCGLLPGIVALILSWEARSKKEAGQVGEAKSYTVAAIICNIISMLLGVGAIIAVSVYCQVYLNRFY